MTLDEEQMRSQHCAREGANKREGRGHHLPEPWEICENLPKERDIKIPFAGIGPGP